MFRPIYHCCILITAVYFCHFLSLTVFPPFSKGNCSWKPPWIHYKSVGSDPVLLLSFSISYKISKNKMSDFVRKSMQDLDLGIGDSPLSLPREFTARAAQANQFSLVVCTVNPRKQNLRALINQMPRVWGFVDTCVGRILGNGRVQFVFRDEESLNLVLRRGPWSFNEWMVSVHRWYPNITDEELKIIPFWVQIRGIPLLYLTGAMARYVGNMLGPVTTVDFDENANMVEFVRVRIDWNVDSPLRFQRIFQFLPGENTVVKYRFERLRNFCTKCGS